MILVFGSIHIDMVMSVDSLPKIGETILSSHYQLLPGGKGANQAVAASRTGAVVKMVGSIGMDTLAATALKAFHSSQVDTNLLQNISNYPTGCASIYVDKFGQNMIVVSSGANQQTSADQIPDSLLKPDTTVLLQMEVPFGENWRLIKKAKQKGCRTILNLAPIPKEFNSFILDDISILVVNEIEITHLGLLLGFDVASPKAIGRYLAKEYDITVVITIGDKGALAFSPVTGWHVDAHTLDQVIDTTGAGDVFVGVFAASLDIGCDIEIALQRASLASGLACTEVGGQPSIAYAYELETRRGIFPLIRAV